MVKQYEGLIAAPPIIAIIVHRCMDKPLREQVELEIDNRQTIALMDTKKTCNYNCKQAFVTTHDSLVSVDGES